MSILANNAKLIKVGQEYSAGSGISIDNYVISVTGDVGGKTYSAGENIGIYEQDNQLYISGKDWANDIEQASANAYEQAIAQIPEPQDLSYISAKVDTNTSGIDYISSVCLTAHQDWTDTIKGASSYSYEQSTSYFDNWVEGQYTGDITNITNKITALSGDLGDYYKKTETSSKDEINDALQYVSANAGKVYEGVSPIVVNNTEDKISADTWTFSAGSNVSFVDDNVNKITRIDCTVTGEGGDPQVNSFVYENSAKINDVNSSYQNNSGNFLTAAPANMATTGDVAELAQTISETYYPNTNPSSFVNEDWVTAQGYITGVDLSEYAERAFVLSSIESATSGKLDVSSFASVSSDFLTTSFEIPESATWNDTSNVVQSNSAQWAEGGGATGDYVPLSATEVKIGLYNTATNDYNFTQGKFNLADFISFSQGYGSKAKEDSLTQGFGNSATYESFAQGSANKALQSSLAQGRGNSALNYSFAQGLKNSAYWNSFSQGQNNSAYNFGYSLGLENSARNVSIAVGANNIAGVHSIAVGYGCEAYDRSQAFGNCVSATNSGMAIGTFNNITTGAFVIGNGNSASRSDCFIIDHEGNVSAAGKISANGVELATTNELEQVSADITATIPSTAGLASESYVQTNSAVLTGMIDGKQDTLTFGYDEQDRINSINCSALAGGGDVPEDVMVESAIGYNAVGEISAYGNSAIAQYGAEKQWLVHDDTLVHASNSAQYALGVAIDNVARLMGVDETVLFESTAADGTTITTASPITLAEDYSNFKRMRIEYRIWSNQSFKYILEEVPCRNGCFTLSHGYINAQVNPSFYEFIYGLSGNDSKLYYSFGCFNAMGQNGITAVNQLNIMGVTGIGRKEV